MSGALVSIVIPTYDRPVLLRRAIRSALRQTYSRVEVLVIDDGPNESGLEVCQEFRDPRLTWSRNRSAKGACGSRNTGIGLARGEYYTGLDDDDYFHPERITVLLDAYRPEFSFVTSNSIMLRNGDSEVRFRGGRVIRLPDLLWGRNCVGTQAFAETSRIRAVGGFDESLAAGQDTDLWIRMVERWGPALRIARCLYTIDWDHDGPRITTTVGASRNMKDYIDRHGSKMSRAQRLVNLGRVSKYENRPYRLFSAVSLCFPASWDYYFKRLVRIW